VGENLRFAFQVLLIAVIFSFSSTALRAEEQAAGHYFPGGLSSAFDMLPALEPWANSPGFQPHFTLALTNDSTYYHGSSNVLDANATSYTNTSVLLCQFPGQISILPGKPQYSVALAVPYTWLKVHNIAGKDTDDGFGDIEMFPIMLNWTKRGGEEGIYGYALEYQTEFGILRRRAISTMILQQIPEGTIGRSNRAAR
jgi:hypothetical protein